MNAQSEEVNRTNINFSRDIPKKSLSVRGSEIPRRKQQKETVFVDPYCEDRFAFKNIDEPAVIPRSNRLLHRTSTSSSYSIIYSNYINTEMKNTSPNHVGNENTNTEKDIPKEHEPRVTYSPYLESHGNMYERERFSSYRDTNNQPTAYFNDQQFLNKTKEKNARLLRIVKQVVIARQLEKEKENWNTFISQLRKKHSDDRPTGSFDTPEPYKDCYNTQFSWNQSNTCQNLLQNFYNANNIMQPHEEFYKPPNEDQLIFPKIIPFKTKTICYPISSQGRFIMLQREEQKELEKRKRRLLHRKSKGKNMPGDHTLSEKKGDKKAYENYDSGFRKSCSCNTNTTTDTSYTQTDSQLVGKNNNGITTMEDNTTSMVSKERGPKESNKKPTLQEYSTQYANKVIKRDSVLSIEEKLDKLIHAINNVILEMNTKKPPKRYYKHNRSPKQVPETVNFTKSDSYGLASRDKIAYNLFENSFTSTRISDINFRKIQHIENNLTKINEILKTDIGEIKTKDAKDSSAGEIYRPCSVQISINIPTKEISTEVTQSLSKPGYNSRDRSIVVEKRDSVGENKRIEIAVNTDPLSLMYFLKISVEDTFKKVLSYVPSIDYYYLLSRLQVPKTTPIESHYVCNICGAAFMKPSELTDHIKKHELGQTRDCVICRHMLDIHRRRPGLFKCQYCGQMFARAYCCELHQRTCATRMGKPHNSTSSLMLLK